MLGKGSSANFRFQFARFASKKQSASFSSPATYTSDLVNVEYPGFDFELTKVASDSKARIGALSTPHGVVHTPNFVFCATKAAMKAVTPEQLRAEDAQIILSNTYHLMLTPGAELVAKMGGLQKMTGWKGPMLTDSGGYQIFSMGYGSVSNEIKGKRDSENLGWNKTLLNIDEQGATFRSYIDGSIHTLTPEKSIDIQRQLGADLIVVLDECTPFNVTKDYTADSMRRSHRWALRCLDHFQTAAKTSANGLPQALYGIIQGGVYEDLRQESCDFVNTHGFFGLAIGGSLGATKKDMHEIVAYTRSLLRDDRPVHLLGIGGVRDIFHGVRCGIDTFDCVHPTRLGRHGGALVMASHWETGDQTLMSSPEDVEIVGPELLTVQQRADKLLVRETDKKLTLEKQLRTMSIALHFAQEDKNTAEVDRLVPVVDDLERRVNEATANIQSLPQTTLQEAKKRRWKQLQTHGNKRQTVREHIHMTRSAMRDDQRPIDVTCTCYTCRNFSRAYLHHLFKAGESLAGMLVTTHNIHYMNRLMKEIRRGIQEDCLDDVQRMFVHPDLADSVGDSLAIGQ